MKPFTNKHSIAAGSPFHMGGSKKSPLFQDDLKEGNFKVIKSTTGLSGESIPTERQAVIPGTPGKTYEEVGVDPAKAQAYWDANPEKYAEYKAGQEDRTVTQTRDVNVEQPRQYVNIFKGRNLGGLDERYTTSDSLSYADQVGIAKSLNIPAPTFKKQFTKVTGLGFTKKPRTTTSSTSGSQNIGDWTTVE